MNRNAKYEAVGTKADISINGLVCATPSDYEALLETQRQPSNGGSNIATTNTNGASGSGGGALVHYEVDGYDVHVLNPQFRVACPEHLLGAAGGRAHLKVSLLLQVTGHVRYGSSSNSSSHSTGSKDATAAAAQPSSSQHAAPRSVPFAEVFVLVPNWDALAPKPPRGLLNFLIMSQNFRAL